MAYHNPTSAATMCLREYIALDEDHRRQLERLYPKYVNNKDVARFMRPFRYPLPGTEERKRLTCYAMSKVMSPIDLIDASNLEALYAYNNGEPPIYLRSIKVKMGAGYILRGNMMGNNVIVKFYYRTYTNHGVTRLSRTTENENNIYERLGKPKPCISTSYRLLGVPVLVMEEMDDVDGSCNEYEMAEQVVRQLKPLHNFGVHCDIKPGNVMRCKKDPTKFYVIDYGGVATTRSSRGGFERHTCSPLWTSQKRRTPGGERTVCSAKHDMMELAYTMNTVRLMRKGIPYKVKDKSDPIRNTLRGRIKRFYEYAKSLPDGEPLTDQQRDVLVQILRTPHGGDNNEDTDTVVQKTASAPAPQTPRSVETPRVRKIALPRAADVIKRYNR
jgi:hypothetical protein